jgi:hypothetical protein
MRTHEFEKSLVVGEYGEKVIDKYLANHPNIISIQDVSKIREYQLIDIDRKVFFKNGLSTTIEIKTDTYTSGNIFYETISNIEYNMPGCLEKSKAEYLFYYFTKTNDLYIIDLQKYRKWFNENKNNPLFCRKIFKNKDKKGGYYTTEGYTIPLTFFESNFKYHKKINIANYQ